MKLTYSYIANQAIEAEQNGDYLKAAKLWEQAKNLTKSEAIQKWAEYRVEHNTLRNSLSNRDTEQAARARKLREKYKLKKEAELLKANIEKSLEEK